MIDPALSSIIAHVESGGSGDTRAIRFEPGVYSGWPFDAAMSRARAANACSQDTARAVCAISWGRFQILGYNLYLDGYSGSIVDFASDIAAQVTALDDFLTKRSINWNWVDLAADQGIAQRFVQVYNGPAGWPDYWTKMQQAARDLKL